MLAQPPVSTKLSAICRAAHDATVARVPMCAAGADLMTWQFAMLGRIHILSPTRVILDSTVQVVLLDNSAARRSPQLAPPGFVL